MTVQGDKRINWLLILQGWAMLWVVTGHAPLGEPCTGPLWETMLYRFAYSFHMPLFMLVSGWLFYRTRISWHYGAVLRDKALRILLPGLVFSLVAYALKIAFPGEMERQVSLSVADIARSYLFPYDNPLRELWFLIALFWMFALLPLWRVTLRCKWGMWLTVALLVALWFFPLRSGLLCLDRVCTHAIWFYLGMVISREEYVERAFSVRPWLTVLIGVAIYAIGLYTLPIVTTAGGILFSFGLALLADRFLPRLFFSFRDYTYQIFLMGIFAQMLVKILYRHALGSLPYLIVWLLCVAVGLYIPVLIARLVERIPFRPLALCLGLRAPKKTKLSFLLTVFCGLMLTVTTVVPAVAQTPEEIVSRMEKEMSVQQKEGVYMVVDMKVPIMGSISTKSWMRDNKTRMEVKMMGVPMISWVADSTEWTYNTKKNELEIKKLPNLQSGSQSDAEGDISMLSGMVEGYDFTLQKETPDEWQIRCTRSKGVDDKDSPKTMTLIVAKTTFLPISLSFKTSGVSISMRDITFGVPLSKVTFNPADYPDATIIDKR